MASRCSLSCRRASVSTLVSAISRQNSSCVSKSAAKSVPRPSLESKPASSPVRRFSFSRSPVELAGVVTLLPLHNAVANARMTSCLSSSSRSCRALSQELGLSVPR